MSYRPEANIQFDSDLEADALRRLDTAEQAADFQQKYESEMAKLHPELVTAVSLPAGDVAILVESGHSFMNLVNERPFHRKIDIRKIQAIVPRYQGLDCNTFQVPLIPQEFASSMDRCISPPLKDEVLIEYPGTIDITLQDDLEENDYELLRVDLPPDDDQLKDILKGFVSLMGNCLSDKDYELLVGIGLVKLTEFFLEPKIKSQLELNISASQEFKAATPGLQAIHGLRQWFKDRDKAVRVLYTLYENAFTGDIEAPAFEYYFYELDLLPQITNAQHALDTANFLTGHIAALSVNNAAISTGQIIDISRANVDLEADDISDEEFSTELQREEYLDKFVHSLSRKAKTVARLVTNYARSRELDELVPDFNSFPSVDRPMLDLLHGIVELQTSATQQNRIVEERASTTKLNEEIAAIRTTYFESRSKCKKKHPASSLLTRLLVSEKPTPTGVSHVALNKDEAYAVVDTMFTLESELVNGDRDMTFDKLFAAADKESKLGQKNNAKTAEVSLNRVTDWLSSNRKFLRASDIPLFRNIGIELHQFMMDDTSKRTGNIRSPSMSFETFSH
jgi:hypothetical protein